MAYSGWLSRIRPSNIVHMQEYVPEWRFELVPDGDDGSNEEERLYVNDRGLDLLTGQLAHAMGTVIKRGIVRNYSPHQSVTAMPRGRIDIPRTIKTNSIAYGKLACNYSVFDQMTYNNMFIHSVVHEFLTITDGDGMPRLKDKEIREWLTSIERNLSSIPMIVLDRTCLSKAVYRGMDQDYRYALELCRNYVMDKYPDFNHAGKGKTLFIDAEHFFKLYEDFIRNFYRRNRPELEAKSETLYWTHRFDEKYDFYFSTDGDEDRTLPEMKTDISLKKGDTVLIIDAKCYSKPMTSRIINPNRGTEQEFQDEGSINLDPEDNYSVPRYRPSNLYQIHSYVTNYQTKYTSIKHVSGMLLYAVGEGMPESFFKLKSDGNWYFVMKLDLRKDWENVKQQLFDISDKMMPINEKGWNDIRNILIDRARKERNERMFGTISS
ncbi:MAG: hypothetical protein LKJ94_02650 [Candidatus Methanomethylophilus sp.]|jgi:5-methylcytosine-specific restriction enzyme subunit McrC|nr:hypothetical protein [Methanomethylophilus sp.]MCI2093690.1 hypothetical protein [Methanomethylophilus sp.]